MLFDALGSFAVSELSERPLPPLRSVLALGRMSAPPFKLEKGWPKSRRFGLSVSIVWSVVFLEICYRIVGSYFYLIYKFGISRVFADRLFVADMPKGRPWTLSDGQVISGGGFFWWLMVTVVFIPLLIATTSFIYRLLPERKAKDAA